MGRIRVYQFAKLLKISNDDALELLRGKGVEVKSALSGIDEELVDKFKAQASGKTKAPEKKRVTKAPATTRSATATKTARGRKISPVTKKSSLAKPKPAAPAAAKPGAVKRVRPFPRAAKPVVAPTKPTPPAAKPAASSARPTIPPKAVTKVTKPVLPVSPPKPSLVVKPQKSTVGPPAAPRPIPVPPPPPKEIFLTEGVTVKELSEKTGQKSKDIIKKLIDQGILVTINQTLDVEIARKLCREFGCEAQILTFEEEAVREHRAEAGKENLERRDPVVTIMGHVDHGKTSLLDAIRQSNIIAREHGGITQHIGAYKVQARGRGITFIDTPGHEAFTLMRSRGAQITDIVVLVVAADDGVMPQTVEAIDHARAAGVPIVVAINKIDKPEANPDRVKKELADRGLLVEDWGGDVVSVSISAKQKLHIEDLLEMILLVSDLHELRADPSVPAAGTVLEARLDRARGPVATILIQNGTLHVGNAFIAGAVCGKVRAMLGDRGQRLSQAESSMPVEVLGLQSVPRAGDSFQVIEDEWKARRIGNFRRAQERQQGLGKLSRLTLDHLHQQIKDGSIKELPIIIKGDVQGSVEVLAKTLLDLGTDQVKVRVIHSATGAVTETDVLLASASNAIIIGFNVRPDRPAAEQAEKDNVDIRLHTVIYEVHREIENAMVGLLEPTYNELYLGRAEVRNTFKIPKIGMVAGTYVVDGKMLRGAQVRLLRNNVIVHSGKMASLKRFKDDVGEVKTGYECGIALEKYNDVKVGDIIEAFQLEKVIPTTL